MIGQTLSHYKILEKLGEGGMGVVYKAHDCPYSIFHPRHNPTTDHDLGALHDAMRREVAGNSSVEKGRVGAFGM